MRNPCRTCPWRKTVRKGGFPGGILDAKGLLRMIDDGMGTIMQCHSTPDGADAKVCVGFAARVGPESTRYRIAVVEGIIDEGDLNLSTEGLLTLHGIIRKHGGRPGVGRG